MSKLDDMIVAGRQVIGAPYKFWGGGPLEACEPMYVNCPGVTPSYVAASGANCAGLLNFMRSYGASLKPVGGTLAYGAFMNPWEYFDPDKWYPVGTIMVDQYIEGTSEGHVVIVSRPNQLVLQAEYPGGVTEDKTAAEQHYWTPFEWAGWMPDVPAADGLPGWGSGGVEGYPGDTATPKETALWMARVAEKIYGLPGILPVMTSCVELTDAWTSEGDVKNVPGYLYPVDHDSLGWFQQRPSAGWGAPWQITNAEYALAKFLDAALANEPAPRPTDPEGLGAWCQAVQRSAYPDAYARKGYPMAAKLLGLAPEPEELKPYQKTGWLKLDGLWQPERSGRPRVWGELGKDGTIKVRDW